MAFSPDSEFLSQTLSSLPMAVMLTDSGSVVRWVNAWFTKVTGYTVDDIIGRNAAILEAQPAADAEPTRAAEPGTQWKEDRSAGARAENVTNSRLPWVPRRVKTQIFSSGYCVI